MRRLLEGIAMHVPADALRRSSPSAGSNSVLCWGPLLTDQSEEVKEAETDPIFFDPGAERPQEPLWDFFGVSRERPFWPLWKANSVPRLSVNPPPSKKKNNNRYGGGLVFCLLFWLFERQKQHISAILRQTRAKGRNKKDDQVLLFSKSALFPSLKQTFA